MAAVRLVDVLEEVKGRQDLGDRTWETQPFGCRRSDGDVGCHDQVRRMPAQVRIRGVLPVHSGLPGLFWLL